MTETSTRPSYFNRGLSDGDQINRHGEPYNRYVPRERRAAGMCFCPTCGHQTEAKGTQVDLLLALQMGPAERAIIKALVEAYPRKTTNAALRERVWANREEPQEARTMICQTMIRLRKKIRPYGWAIPHARSGAGSEGYRLDRK